MLTDIEIASNNKLKHIKKIAKGLKIKNYTLFSDKMAKIELNEISKAPKGKLILVTAINPTKFGEGKTTVSIGLADALQKLKQKACLALREPSLGPVFGVKGGACGGGYSQIVPMENINLHFTGDFHAITSANNLLCSAIDNHIFQGNALNINKVVFKRCVDLNDRALRKVNLETREDNFTITSASETMAIMCNSINLQDLKNRLSNILIGYNKKNLPVYAKDLKVEDAMTILLKEALKPNLVQTLEHTPAIVHLGPFANIAHGCNSILATKLALSKADYVVTEAGFGADLGAEKFLDFKCQYNNLNPACIVLVATIKALKVHGGEDIKNITKENSKVVSSGLANLLQHANNLQNVYNANVVICLNKYATDFDSEINIVENFAKTNSFAFAVSSAFIEGGNGAVNLAKEVIEKCKNIKKTTFAYQINDSILDKLKSVAKKVYHADDVVLSDKAKEDLKLIKKLKLEGYPVIIAKTQYSFSDDQTLLNAPKHFKINISELLINNGSRFIVATAGKMLLMPALNKTPAYENMSIDEFGKIKGLF